MSSNQSTHSRIKSLNIGEILNFASDSKKGTKSFKLSQKIDKSRHLSPDLSTNAKNLNQTRFSPDRATLVSIRSRKYSKSPEITPNLAVEVVKDYLIPLFKYDKKHKQDKYRVDTYSVKNTQNYSINVKSELLLSEQISQQNKELEIQFKDLEMKYKEAMQTKALIEKDYQTLNEKFLDLQSEYKILEYNSRTKQSHYNYLELGSDLIRSQIEKLQRHTNSLESDKNKLSLMIYEEKHKNDIRLFLTFSLTTHISKATALLKPSTSLPFYF